jgi:hypothetical protein
MMVKMTYGGFEPNPESRDDKPWTKLATINEHLEAGEALPPYLASWLGQAIQYADRDPNELLRRLGLKRGRGRQHHRHAPDAWLKWGQRVYSLRGDDETAEAVLSKVMAEYQAATGVEVERSQLQSWHDQYRAAWREAHCQ